MSRNKHMRKAIAMIELIFAIVIIGITLISAPQLISTSTQSSYVALQQESIAAAATQMNMIFTTQWDHSDTNSTLGEPVLTTGSTTFTQCTSGVNNPVGVTSSIGRHCFGIGGPINTTYPASAIGTDGSAGESIAYDDVDDYHNRSYTVQVYESDSYATHLGDYIDRDINITSSIFYGNDAPSGTVGQTTTYSNLFQNNTPGFTTNIKLFTINLSSTNASTEVSDKNIRMSAFMCNIGAPSQYLTNESSL
jgi:type II secretory pathway pseudopilin PulG